MLGVSRSQAKEKKERKDGRASLPARQFCVLPIIRLA
jgi:hypothetical protein